MKESREVRLEEGLVLVNVPFQLENGLLGAVIKMLTEVLHFVQVFFEGKKRHFLPQF